VTASERPHDGDVLRRGEVDQIMARLRDPAPMKA
jgi:hypothetical protein